MQNINHSCNTSKFSKCHYSLTYVLNVDTISFSIWALSTFHILNYNYNLLSINYRFHHTFFRSQSAVRSFLALHPATPCCLVEPSNLYNEMESSKATWKWFLSIFHNNAKWNTRSKRTFIVWEKKQNVLSLCNESTGTCFTPNITEASDKSSWINAPAFAYA